MKNNIKAIVGVGIVAATGLFGTALAAGITVPDAGRIGQGANTVAGYNTTDVKYAVGTDGVITSVSFNIYEGTANQSTAVTNTGTSVYAQILAASPGAWSAACTMATPRATCTVSGTTATAATGISVVAFKS